MNAYVDRAMYTYIHMHNITQTHTHHMVGLPLDFIDCQVIFMFYNFYWSIVDYRAFLIAQLVKNPMLCQFPLYSKADQLYFTYIHSFLRSCSHMGHCNEQSSLCYIIGSFYVSILYLVMCILEKAMATHPSTLVWEIPWMEEPGRLQSMGS